MLKFSVIKLGMVDYKQRQVRRERGDLPPRPLCPLCQERRVTPRVGREPKKLEVNGVLEEVCYTCWLASPVGKSYQTERQNASRSKRKPLKKLQKLKPDPLDSYLSPEQVAILKQNLSITASMEADSLILKIPRRSFKLHLPPEEAKELLVFLVAVAAIANKKE